MCDSSFSGLVELLTGSSELSMFYVTELVLVLPYSSEFSFLEVSPGKTFVGIDNMHVSYTILVGGQVFSFRLFLSFLDRGWHGAVAPADVGVVEWEVPTRGMTRRNKIAIVGDRHSSGG